MRATRERPPPPLAMRLVAASVAVACVLVGAACAATRHGPAPSARLVAGDVFRGVPARGRAVVVWAVGDGAAGTRAARAVGARIAADRPARVMYLGDVYDADTAAEFRARMQDAYGPLLRRMLPTPGNHEWPGRRVGYNLFWQRITRTRTPPWYAVRIGGWQVLSLNSEAPHGARSAQLRWLRRQLHVRAGCRMAFWHRPRFSAGRHGDQPDVAPLWDAVAGRAALVVNGHDHDMQRLRPVDGTTEVVAGAGGNGHYPVDRADRRVAFADDTTDGALRVVLRPRRAELSFVDVSDRVLDRATVRCMT